MMKGASFVGRPSIMPWRCRLTSRRGACCWPSQGPPKRTRQHSPGLKKNKHMSKITIVDLEVFYNVGVSDRVEKTIDYNEVCKDMLKFGEGRSWKLLERLVTAIADHILAEYKPQAVWVEIKKFVIPQARYVAVNLTRAAR